MSTDAQAKAYTEFDYKDAQGIEIRAYVWLPGPVGSFDDTDVIASASTGGEPHAIVQIAHGIGEHALRYDRFEVRAAPGGAELMHTAGTRSFGRLGGLIAPLTDWFSTWGMVHGAQRLGLEVADRQAA